MIGFEEITRASVPPFDTDHMTKIIGGYEGTDVDWWESEGVSAADLARWCSNKGSEDARELLPEILARGMPPIEAVAALLSTAYELGIMAGWRLREPE